MRTTKPELSAIAYVSGPLITPAELATKQLIAEMDAVEAQIAATPKDVRLERSAAVLAGIVTAADAEAVRSLYWTKTPLAARRVACMAGNLHRDRANDALKKFDALDRGIVHLALDRLIHDLQNLQRCMNGGRIASSSI